MCGPRIDWWMWQRSCEFRNARYNQLPVSALTELHAGQHAALYVELYYFLLPTKRSGGLAAGCPGLKTTVGAVLHEFFRSFRQPIKPNTGTAAYIELNPKHFLVHSFTRIVMRFTRTLRWMRILAILYALSRIAARIRAKIYMIVTLLEATKIQYFNMISR